MMDSLSSSSYSSSSSNYKLFNVTLSLPSNRNKNGNNNNNNLNNRNDKEIQKRQWESLQVEWGMGIVREVVYRQYDILLEDDHAQGIEPYSSSPSDTCNNDNMIKIDGCDAMKVKDELIISDLFTERHPNDNILSPAQHAGLQRGDIIHAIYGMKNPKLSFLYGIMRDSITFQVTIKRNVNRGNNDSDTSEHKHYQQHLLSDADDTHKYKDVTREKVHVNANDKEKDKFIIKDQKNHKEGQMNITSNEDHAIQNIKCTNTNGCVLTSSNVGCINVNSNTFMEATHLNSCDNKEGISNIINTTTVTTHTNMQSVNTSNNDNDGNNNCYDDFPDVDCDEIDRLIEEHEKRRNTPDVGKEPRSQIFSHLSSLNGNNNNFMIQTSLKVQLQQEESFVEKESMQGIDNSIDADEGIKSSEEVGNTPLVDDSAIKNSIDLDSSENELASLIELSVAKAELKGRENNKEQYDNTACDADSSAERKSKKKRKRKDSLGSINEQKQDTFCNTQLLNDTQSTSVNKVDTHDNNSTIPVTKTTCRPRQRSLSGASVEIGGQVFPKSRSNSPMISGPIWVRQFHSSVQSTSSKAGLSMIKNTKLKRLWPDSFVFMKKIMKWAPPKVLYTQNGDVQFHGPIEYNGNQDPLYPIPQTFRDGPDIIKHLTPHILDEGMRSLHQEFLENSRNQIWTRPIHTLYLRNCTPVEPKSSTSASVRLYEFAFQHDSTDVRPPTNLGEIFVIHSPTWKQSCCLGFIGSNDINSTFLTDQKTEDEDLYDLYKLWVCISISAVENSGWLHVDDMPSRNSDGSFIQVKMHATNIGTCTDMMRQYEGLKSLDCLKANLRRAVFCEPEDGFKHPKLNVLDSLTQPVKPSSVISDVWNIISKQTNTYQLFAIESVMLGRAKENITLLQGPPGTGKTLTIVALVSALLNGSVPNPGAKNQKTAGTKVQIGKALSSSEGKPLLKAPVAKRILVCAPSNQAVDELAWKLHMGSIGTDGKYGSFKIIRFGMLPGEDRHDGRGRRYNSSKNLQKKFKNSRRNSFLFDINLDILVNRIAEGREINDYAHRTDASKSAGKSRQSRFINYSAERQKILSECHVICTTLSGAGSKAFADAVSRDEFPSSEFDAVIIDEACQGSEMACLIPLKFNPNAVILVGDPKQLPVMTFSRDAEQCKADRSLFERLHDNGFPIHLLRYQYRMHEEIASFPSRTFYNNLLITSDSVRNRGPAHWHLHPSKAFPPYLIWNLGGHMKRGKNGGLSNVIEADFVCNLLNAFRQSVNIKHVRNITIGVIAFYNDQVSLINQKLNACKPFWDWMNRGNVSIQVSTVDGFQGSEKDIIILSCVRSKWLGKKTARKEIGFLKDFRRVNVSLTRAKHSLWILGHCEVLNTDELWNTLIDDARNRNLIANAHDLDFFLGRNVNDQRQYPHHRNRLNKRNKNQKS